MTNPGQPATPSSDAGLNGTGPTGAPYPSILGSTGETAVVGPADDDAFVDLHLDQIVAGILGEADRDLAPLFRTSLPSVAAIEYRHEIFRDLRKPAVLDAIRSLTTSIRSVYPHVATERDLNGRYAAEGAFIEAVTTYTEAVASFADVLPGLDIESRGLSELRDHVVAYASSAAFAGLVSETRETVSDLTSVRYTVTISGRRVRVGRYRGEADYGEEIERTFARFGRGEQRRYTRKMSVHNDIGHVEERILGLVARLYPEVFDALDAYVARNRSFVDEPLIDFTRGIRFYLDVLAFLAPLERAGLPFCFPTVVDGGDGVHVRDGFDLALADRLVRSRTPIVTNDFDLGGDERIMVVTGPNQGGKTTFARMFGQIHHLAAVGCPVPGSSASIPLTDHIFTHFEREEHVENLRGKLADDLVRVRSMFERATPETVLIMNETLNSTTLTDARFLGEKLLDRITGIGARCVYVTFVDDLAAAHAGIVSMVGGVTSGSEEVRTYEIVRRPADGRAYALALAERYGLTYEQLKGRIGC